MRTLTISLQDDLQAKLEGAARANGKTVADVYAEAAGRYIAHRGLDDLGRRGRAYAQSLDRKPSDVLRLIDDRIDARKVSSGVSNDQG